MTAARDCATKSAGDESARSLKTTCAAHRSTSAGGAFYRIGVPIALWIAFANIASHYHKTEGVLDAPLREAVEAELTSRRCPGLRLDPIGFKELAQERGINHADLYQKRSFRLKKLASHLERDFRINPEGGCKKMFNLYGETGSTLHLLTRR